MAADKRKPKAKGKGRVAKETQAAAKDPGPPYRALWHPAADAERDASWPPEEKVAMLHAVQKLEAAGPRLGSPHSSAVQGEAGRGLRELRPRAGRSRWRPIYRRVKLSEMTTNDELIAEQLRDDPEFRGEWERTTLARAVAVAIVRYRAEHDLSQRELAGHLGMKQPQVARLELGEVNPSMETLMRVSAQLGIEFTIDVRPAGTTVHNVTKRAQANNRVGSVRTSEAEILVAAR